MINLLGFGDAERWVIMFFISLSLYFLWTDKKLLYDKRSKILLTIPRTYILLYNFLIISDLYTNIPGFNDLVRTGIINVYGAILLFGVEAYIRWITKKYGRC